MLHGILLSLALAVGPSFPSDLPVASQKPDAPEIQTPPHSPVTPDTVYSRWVLSLDGSEARYRVREQLVGFEFPNDAVGTTSDLTGILVLEQDGSIVSGESEFRVRLSSLATDNERRDGYVRNRTLEVEKYPEAVLVPSRFLGISAPLPESGSTTFQLEAALTLHGQTRPTVWEVIATFGPDTVTGMATTSFPFETFGIAVPQVARVLSVTNNIHLELQFRMIRESLLP